MKSVAIVGFSPLTLPYTKNSKADEVWTLNHAYRMVPDPIPRIDRHFEIHDKLWFLRKESHKSNEYWEWLKQKHNFPIYMQEPNEEIPSSVKYPYDEVVRDIFGLFRPYFTSSFSYMLGLAILEKFQRVEIYGIEMETDTEYAYQKPGGEFMIGVALGRGINVVLRPECRLCLSEIYGYEAIPHITRPKLLEIQNLYFHQLAAYTQKQSEMVEQYNSGNKEILNELLETSAMANAYEGGYKVLSRLLEEADYFLGKQNLEGQRRQYQHETDYHKGTVNAKKAEWEVTQNGAVWQEYLGARATMFANMGATQAIAKLIAMCDLRVVNLEMCLTIKEY